MAAEMLNQFSLARKVIVVTGGTGILGGAFLEAIVRAGAAVVVLGRNEQIANARAENIIANGGRAMPLIADVMNRTQLEEAKNKVIQEWGHIDGLVNGAGGNLPVGSLDPGKDIFEMDLEGMRQVMDLNVWGTLLPTQVFGESIAKGNGGSIVNISSMNSKRAITKVLGYNMGKAAIDCYNQWYAVELARRYGDKVRMNALAPGFFLTDQNRRLLTTAQGGFTERGEKVINQTPFGRMGEPSELGGTLVWLLSDASRFVTGAMICVDGGFSAFGGV